MTFEIYTVFLLVSIHQAFGLKKKVAIFMPKGKKKTLQITD
jgi:hypothetical protein